MKLTWYAQRFAAMSPAEIRQRTADAAYRRLWRFKLPPPPKLSSKPPTFAAIPGLAGWIQKADPTAVEHSAHMLLHHHWPLFEKMRNDVTATVDYYVDPWSTKRAPSTTPAFSIDHRNEAEIGNVKNIWELARHQHLSVASVAYATTEDNAFALRVRDELNHFFTTAPFCSGVHWTSGIEIALRLISWTWIRRLLDNWADAPKLFEQNPVFCNQVGRSQQWLARFSAHGSSANNHLIAEAAGAYVAASAFPFHQSSSDWRERAAHILVEQARTQTFPDGLNRELASDYHGFVTELVLAAYLEARVQDDDNVTDALEPTLQAALYALGSTVDVSGQPHHQGDADNGHGWLVDAPSYDRWDSLLSTADVLFTTPDWWNQTTHTDIRSAIVRAVVETNSSPSLKLRPSLPAARTNHFTHAGLTILRTHRGSANEVWVRMDHGPHGYLATAAHAHADALAIEIRHNGQPIVVDPGTYCYHGQPLWRDYFRSTAAHTTVEIGNENQSTMAGPFLWRNHCDAKGATVEDIEDGKTTRCSAYHDGYVTRFGLRHRRTVTLDRTDSTVTVVDQLESVVDRLGPTPVALRFHFHPTISVAAPASPSSKGLEIETQLLSLHQQQTPGQLGQMELDRHLCWSLTKGQTTPPLGWYSPVLGQRQPCWTLTGTTVTNCDAQIVTVFRLKP